MKFSYNWLKELSGTKKSPKELAELLTMRSFEVEGIEKAKSDNVLDIKILADRGHDCLSHIGIAREITALEGKKFVLHYGKSKIKNQKSKIVKIDIQDKKLCPRYIGAVMTNIKIGPSPKWMQERLITGGLRPINNIVDATNYVMLETGQPLHAFDADKIKDQKSKIKIIIRKAKKGEKIKLLDETEKVLADDDLVIADSQKALAIAGIKGGVEAEIGENTQTIVLEAANFNPTAIRKSRIRLGLKTDASDRFEKEIDPNLAEIAMARVVWIIEEFGGKTEGMFDVYPSKVNSWKIKLDLNYVNKLLGENIPVKAVTKILKSLGLLVTGYGSQVTVTVPTFRIDLKTQEDLVEEIGRIYGYEKIKPQAPHAPIQAAEVNEQRLFEREVKNILAGKGFSEVYNYSFYSARDAGLAGLGAIEHLELENPMNPDQALMRVSLIPGILKNINHNLKYFDDFRIFEIGRVYWTNKTILPEEKNMLAGAIVMEESSKKEALSGVEKAKGFYELKSYADVLLSRIGIDDYYFDTFDAVPNDSFSTLWHEGRTAEIKIEGHEKAIGFLGEINPFLLANFDIHKRVACFEFDLEKLQEISQSEREYQPVRKYPEVIRDISMIARSNVLVDEILAAIQKAGGNLVLDVDLFDIFDFADSTSSYAFHIIFGAENRTLKSGEVDELMKKISSVLEKDLKVKVRK
ncbi:MAG: phenylalanine--tRNA ligase subunit beta [Candidatus Moranbacteria bacterium]|nr:phenylalanine--tRNA ligase subunit beta [Candidatus Moranbacteria bacterium]